VWTKSCRPMLRQTRSSSSSSSDLDSAGSTSAQPPKTPTADEEDLEDPEEMFVQGPNGVEWGGPTRGGRHAEPTRFGDWERKGRVSDF